MITIFVENKMIYNHFLKYLFYDYHDDDDENGGDEVGVYIF